jgi:hypothetical protein
MDFIILTVIPVFILIVACVLLFVKNEGEDKAPVERILDDAQSIIKKSGIKASRRNLIFVLAIVSLLCIMFQLFFRYQVTSTGNNIVYRYDRLTGETWLVSPYGQKKVGEFEK